MKPLLYNLFFGELLLPKQERSSVLNGRKNVTGLFLKLSALCSVLSIVFTLDIQAQNLSRRLDSLKKVYHNANHDSIRTLTLLQRGQFFEISANYDSAIHELKAAEKYALKLDEKQKNFFFNSILNSTVLTYYHKGSLDSALEVVKRQLDLSLRLNDMSNTAIAYNLMGLIYQSQGNFTASSELLLKALRTAEEAGDSLTMFRAGGNLGNSLQDAGDYDGMYKYALKTLQISKEKNILPGFFQSYLNISSYHDHYNRTDSAVYYLKLCLNLAEKNNRSDMKARALNNIAGIYQNQGQYRKAIKYYSKAAPLFMNFSKPFAARTLINLSRSYNFNGEPFKAKVALDGIKEIEDKLLTLSLRRDIARGYYLIFKELNRSDSALKYLEFSKYYSDSLSEMNSAEAVADAEKKYDTEKKEAKISLLEQEEKHKAETIKKQEQLIYTAVAALVMTLLSLFFIIRSAIRRKQVNKTLAEKNNEITAKSNSLELAYAEINQQKEEIQAQADNLREVNTLLSENNNEIKKVNEKITDSIRYAETIQAAVLPHRKRLKSAFSDFFLLNMPKQIVSGDFYWLEERGQYTFLAVADCTGHGVPGAFMSMLGSSFLTEIIDKEHVLAPDRILERLDIKVREQLNQAEGRNSDGMDITLCRIEEQASNEFVLEFTGAKMPLFLSHDGKFERIKGTTRSIGGRKSERKWETHTFHLQSGDRIFLATDGITDQLSEDRKKFSTAVFKELLNVSAVSPLSEVKHKINLALTAHKGQTSQTDDITILGIQL